jgi:hypothetical protein
LQSEPEFVEQVKEDKKREEEEGRSSGATRVFISGLVVLVLAFLV